MLEIFIEDSFMRQGFDIMLFEKNNDNEIEILKIASETHLLDRHKTTSVIPESCKIHITPKKLQELSNRLWELGFRPQQGHGSVGQLAAVQNHLADLKEVNQKLFSILEKKENANISNSAFL